MISKLFRYYTRSSATAEIARDTDVACRSPQPKTDVTPAIFSHEFSRASFLARQNCKCDIASHASFLTVVQLYFQIELYSNLCNFVDRMLNANWSVVIIVFVLLLFAVHISLFP